MLFNGQKTTSEKTISPEQKLELQNLINSQSGNTVDTGTWVTNTGSTK